MSRVELAGAVTAYLRTHHRYQAVLDAGPWAGWNAVITAGRKTWYREAFRVVLGVATDADLGFHVAPGAGGD